MQVRAWIGWLAVLTGVALGPAAGATTLTRGPYLQLLTTRSVTVVWNTDAAAACGLSLRKAEGAATTVGGPTGTVCAIALDGLVPGGRYAYVPLADGKSIGTESSFHTDDPAQPFSFLVLGDSGTGGSRQLAVRDRMLATPADFLLHTGDLVYLDGLAEDFDPKVFAPYRDLMRRLVLWPCVGNHDVRTAGGAPWRDAFYTPANNPAGNEKYYSFDVGNAHVVVLDSNGSLAPGSPQHTFLDQDLGASRATWKFVAFHHTIYSSGGHGSTLTLRANLVPLFDKHEVDLVFMGHDHDYERTKPLRADQIVAAGASTVYVTTGGGGGESRPVGASGFTAYSEAAFHFVRVAIDGGRLLLQMIREDGTIRDTMTLTKATTPAVPRCGDELVNQPEEQCDGADHAGCPGGCTAACTCAPVCGDARVNAPGEECDGADDEVCPGRCGADCRCVDPTLVLDLEPVADTYIEAGTQATWDHGASDHLDVDEKPVGLTYLKFDLSALTAPVASARLTLLCTNETSDGGTLYPVADSSWVEGTRTGVDSRSATGSGLKWTDVETNRNGIIDGADASPYVPDFSHPVGSLGLVTVSQLVTVDVTAAFQGGAGVYTLAVKNDSTNGATYGSRERSRVGARPRLHLSLRPWCTSQAECDDGDTCTDDGCAPATGCTHRLSTAPCDDGDACTTADTCREGACAGGPAPDCNDDNACTDERCDPAVGCVSVPNRAACDDDNACTTTDTCAAGTCVGGAALACDDHNGCTGDACDPATGCVYAANTAPCDDGDPCTLADGCFEGACGGLSSCGNGVAEPGCEECDGADSAACPGACDASCRCAAAVGPDAP